MSAIFFKYFFKFFLTFFARPIEEKYQLTTTIMFLISKDLSALKINILKMSYSIDELKNELLRCYKNEGKVTTEILNSPDTDYPTQMTYYNYFGGLREAKESVGIIANHTSERVIEDIKRCYDRHENVSCKLLNEDDDLVNYNIVYKHFGSLWDAVRKAGIDVEDARVEIEQERKYTDEELIESLYEYKEKYGDTSTSTIDSNDGPSSTVYRKAFGSLPEARMEAGIDPSFKGAPNGKASSLVSTMDYEEADGHVYVLEMTIDDEKAFYVGETTNIERRIKTYAYNPTMYVRANGAHGNVLAPREKSNVMNDIEVQKVLYTIPMKMADEEDEIEFRRRRKYKEHHQMLSVAIDKETLEVYGGR